MDYLYKKASFIFMKADVKYESNQTNIDDKSFLLE
jgi:hypothetical protein